jgi:hypothetical protein
MITDVRWLALFLFVGSAACVRAGFEVAGDGAASTGDRSASTGDGPASAVDADQAGLPGQDVEGVDGSSPSDGPGPGLCSPASFMPCNGRLYLERCEVDCGARRIVCRLLGIGDWDCRCTNTGCESSIMIGGTGRNSCDACLEIYLGDCCR